MFFVSLRLELQMPDQIEPSLPDLIETVTCPSESDSPTHLVAEVDEDDGDVLGDEREEKNEDDGEADEEQDGQHQYDDDAVSLDMADEEIAVVSDKDDAEGDGGGDGGGDDGDGGRICSAAPAPTPSRTGKPYPVRITPHSDLSFEPRHQNPKSRRTDPRHPEPPEQRQISRSKVSRIPRGLLYFQKRKCSKA